MSMFMTFAVCLSLGVAFISISVYRALPFEVKFIRWYIPVRKAIMQHKFIAICVNWGLSMGIVEFIGSGMVAGFSNFMGSAIFATYIFTEPWLLKVWPIKQDLEIRKKK